MASQSALVETDAIADAAIDQAIIALASSSRRTEKRQSIDQSERPKEPVSPFSFSYFLATSTVNSSLHSYDHGILSGTGSGQLRMLLDVSAGRNTRFEDVVQSHSVVSYLGVERVTSPSSDEHANLKRCNLN